MTKRNSRIMAWAFSVVLFTITVANPSWAQPPEDIPDRMPCHQVLDSDSQQPCKQCLNDSLTHLCQCHQLTADTPSYFNDRLDYSVLALSVTIKIRGEETFLSHSQNPPYRPPKKHSA